MTERGFEDLVGQTIVSVDGAYPESTQVTLALDGGARVVMEHQQDCCEHVRLVDVAGDVADLVGTPLVLAEEVSNADAPAPEGHRPDWDDSYTWTFYKLATVNGHVTMRWLGESNGYYSEAVNVAWRDAPAPVDVPDVFPAHVAEIVYGHSRNQSPRNVGWDAECFEHSSNARTAWEAR